MCYSQKDREAREAREEARRKAQREQEGRGRREESAGKADKRAPERELIRA